MLTVQTGLRADMAVKPIFILLQLPPAIDRLKVTRLRSLVLIIAWAHLCLRRSFGSCDREVDFLRRLAIQRQCDAKARWSQRQRRGKGSTELRVGPADRGPGAWGPIPPPSTCGRLLFLHISTLQRASAAAAYIPPISFLQHHVELVRRALTAAHCVARPLTYPKMSAADRSR